MSPALQDRFLTAGPPGKSPDGLFVFRDSDIDFAEERRKEYVQRPWGRN